MSASLSGRKLSPQHRSEETNVMVSARVCDEFKIELDLRRHRERIVSPIAKRWSGLISIAHQIAQRLCGFAGSHLLQDCSTRSASHDDLRMDDDGRGKFVQQVQMMAKGLLDEMPLSYTGSANVAFEQVAS